MKNILSQLRISVVATFALTVILCVVYPLAVWAVGQTFFSHHANGTLIEKDGKVVGSELIGQNFSSLRYFHSRPSAAGKGYDAANSSGSNLGPTSQKQLDAVKAAAERYRKINGLSGNIKIPVDAVTASGSGLDPHISPKNAALQAPRVAKERGLSETTVTDFVHKATEGREFGIFGDERVNVVVLNLALDGFSSK